MWLLQLYYFISPKFQFHVFLVIVTFSHVRLSESHDLVSHSCGIFFTIVKLFSYNCNLIQNLDIISCNCDFASHICNFIFSSVVNLYLTIVITLSQKFEFFHNCNFFLIIVNIATSFLLNFDCIWQLWLYISQLRHIFHNC